MIKLFWLTAILVFISGCGNDSTSSNRVADPKIGEKLLDKKFDVNELSAGGYVIYFRHTERDRKAKLPAKITEIDNTYACMPGTELTLLGKEQALGLAGKLSEIGVKVDQVYASPTCRTRQMAELMFGDDFELRRELIYTQMRLKHENKSLDIFLRALLSAPIRRGYNRILLAHGTVLPQVGVDHKKIAQGDAIVLKRKGRSGFQMMGVIPFTHWRL